MPVNGLSVGRDFSFGYYDANTGRIVDLGSVQNVRVTRQKHDLANRPYNDVPTFAYIPDGYSFSFTITRTSAGLEDFQLAADTAFNAGNIIKSGYLNETITNPDGTVSRYQYTGVVFNLTDISDVSREGLIKMTAVGMASDKKQIA